MKRLKRKHIILIIILASALIYILISHITISTKTYIVTSPLLNEGSSIKIILIADLHNSIFGRNQSILINKIMDINPDLIIMAGDIYDSVSKMTGVSLLLSGIAGTAPIYFVTGNHEYLGRNIRAIRDELISYGVIILSDNYEIININNNEIVIAGTEDPYKRFYETPNYNQIGSMEMAFRELDEYSLFKIFTAHRPEMINEYLKFSFNLILTGHTHGGQIRIPFIMNGLFASNQGFFPKYAGGIYLHDKVTHIISRGLSINHPRIPRIFNPPELVSIILEFER